jgi:hypothetical protein
MNKPPDGLVVRLVQARLPSSTPARSAAVGRVVRRARVIPTDRESPNAPDAFWNGFVSTPVTPSTPSWSPLRQSAPP